MFDLNVVEFKFPGHSVGAYPRFGRVRFPHITCHCRRVRPLRQWPPSCSDATGQLLGALQPPPSPRSGLRVITDSRDICWGGASASPGKVGRKITRWEFVDMAELLPECWSSFGPKESVSTPGTRFGGYRRRRAVTDIATWVQYFATYVSVMSTPHPQAVPELLAYLIFVLWASQDFGGIAWMTYDAAFRRQAFITGNRQWSKANPSLYSICFSGVARTGQRCELCLSLTHLTRECTMVNDPDPDVSARLKTLESAVLAFYVAPLSAAGAYPSHQVTRYLQKLECREVPHATVSVSACVQGLRGPESCYGLLRSPPGTEVQLGIHCPGHQVGVSCRLPVWFGPLSVGSTEHALSVTVPRKDLRVPGNGMRSR